MNRKIIFAMVGLFSVFLFMRVQILSPKVNITNGDAGGRYHPIASNLVAGNGFSNRLQTPFIADDFDQPLYPLFVASIYWLTDGSEKAVAVVQFFLEIMIILLTLKLARMFDFSKNEMILVAFFATILPFLAIYSNQLLTEILATFGLTLLCWVFVSIVKSKNYLLWVCAGILCGVCLLIRSDTLISVILMIFVAFIIFIIRFKLRAIPFILVFTISFGFIMFPWTLRNYNLNGNFQPLGRVTEQTDFGYVKWLNTWLTEPSDVAKFWWGKWILQTPLDISQSDACCESRERADYLIELAHSQKSFDGEVSDGFTELAVKNYQQKPLKSYLFVRLQRGFFTLIRLPMYVKNEMYRVNIYLIWYVFLGLAFVGTISLSANRICLIPLALFCGRIFLPLYSSLGAEPRYLIESLPILYLSAAVGFCWLFRKFQTLKSAKN